MSGWIKVHRKLLDWEWYSDTNCRLLFIHCLLKANFEDTKWRGVDIKKGSFISSLANLAKSTGLSLRSLRTAISKLESTSELTSKGHAEYTVFTVVKYNEYQSTDKPPLHKTTKKRQATDKLPTTDKEEEEFKEEKESNIPSFEIFSSYAEDKKPKVCLEALERKYDTWVESDWHDGHGSKILNWKVKLLNTLPYIKERVLADSELTPEERTRKANASTI